jgi:hypothetical protein
MIWDTVEGTCHMEAVKRGICIVLKMYLDKAMQHARYEHIEDGSIFATIPGFEGLWASAPTQADC